MFGWLEDLVGYLLSPIWSFLYDTLIVGMLKVLNYCFQAFDFVAGANTSTLLFNTSLVDGEPQLNFFQSDSPLKPMYMTMLYIAGSLLAVFGTIGVFAALSSGDSKARMTKLKNVAGSTTGIFLVPLVFLTVLSLFGALIDAIVGGQVVMSSSDIGIYQTETRKQVEKLLTQRDTFLGGVSSDQVIAGCLDENGNGTSFTVAEIYDNMQDDGWGFDTSQGNTDPVSEAANRAEQALYDIATAVKSPEYETYLNDILTYINTLEPNMQNQVMADGIREVIVYFSGINAQIHTWLDASNEVLLNYKPLELDSQGNLVQEFNEEDMVVATNPKYIAIYNFQLAFNQVYGTDSSFGTTSYQVVNNLQSFLTETNTLIDGSLQNPTMGLEQMYQRVTLLEDNDLVVILYQFTTGRDDTLWYEAKWIYEAPEFLIIGAAIIAFAIVFMAQNVLFALTRLINLGMFFLISPLVIIPSAVDSGTAFKGWLRMVLGNLFGILGIVVVLEVYALLYTGFRDILDASDQFQGTTGELLKLFLLAMFGLSGVAAAKTAGQQVGTIWGFGAGMTQGIQWREAGAMIAQIGKGMKLGTVGLAKGAGKVLGLTSKNQSGNTNQGGQGQNESSSTNQSPLLRQRVRSSIGQAMDSRVGKPLSVVSGGKLGTTQSKKDYAAKKQQVAQHKKNLSQHKLDKVNTKLAPRAKPVGESKQTKLLSKHNKRGASLTKRNETLQQAKVDKTVADNINNEMAAFKPRNRVNKKRGDKE